MNTDIITVTEILGTDSVASSRITINENFKKLVRAVGDLQTRIDTSKNTLYINIIETESGEFAIKTSPNHTIRFKIDNSGNIFIGNMPLDEYIRRVVSNTKFVDLTILDENDEKMNFQIYSGVANNDEGERSKAAYVTVYYSEETSFKAKITISEDIAKIYPNAQIVIYENNETNIMPLDAFMSFGEYIFDFDDSNKDSQRTLAILWLPDTSIQETYTFTLQKIEN